MSKGKYGFTLIELLVVISIIALLMSIMLPALGMVKKLSQATVCMSNLRQWGVVHQMYANDNDDRLPTSSWSMFNGFYDYEYFLGKGEWPPWFPWPVTLFKYYKDPQLLLCPSAKKRGTIADDYWERTSLGGKFEAWVWPDAPIPAQFNSRRSDVRIDILGSYGRGANYYNWRQWKGKAEAPLLTDGAHGMPHPRPFDEPPEYDGQIVYSPYTKNDMRYLCIRRHPGWKNNCLFLDFHVRKVTLKELWRLKWTRRWPMGWQGSELIYHDPPRVWNDPAHWMYNCPEE